ncbi:MAG: nucleoid occlusion factor SlmA [Casimicrobiaceae bacterium]|nr:nucleoid occlusion factor SlmA [Casimicrobiaceae bacterium]MCX8098281.1 nucleoid occlusion factor SlmA [Casimicrobiaceae bacterium]MDW8311782.1 nucleoid occlusion factor SlmA [Burkholderiales bacterium]
MALKPGERRAQILQALAAMLEEPDGEKVTTAALAARVGVSEAALYRHFASKAQMFEALIDFIEESVFALVNQIIATVPDGRQQVAEMVAMLLAFAEKNPGMVRVLAGDALVHEDARLRARINRLEDRLEATFRQALQLAGHQAYAVAASVVLAFVVGRWQLYSKSALKRRPTERWEALEQVLAL